MLNQPATTQPTTAFQTFLRTGLPQTHHLFSSRVAVPARATRPSIRFVLESVAQYGGVTIEQLTARDRSDAHVVNLRHVGMWLAVELSGASLPATATAFKRSHHTTVMYARDKVRQRMAADEEYRTAIGELRESIVALHAQMRERMISDDAFRAEMARSFAVA